jgi:hypothetical protein
MYVFLSVLGSYFEEIKNMYVPASYNDAGASLHTSHAPASQPTQRTHSMRKRGTTISYSNFEFESSTFNVCKAVRAKKPCLCTGIDVDSLNGCKAEI